MDIELRLLRSFEAVARHEHVGRAAEELFVSQPALSQQIKQLEQRLGLALFDRIGRRIVLTEAGCALRDELPSVFGALDRAVAAALGERARTTLTVGSVDYGTHFLVTPSILAFGAHHPEIDVRRLEVLPDRFRPELEAGRIDVAVGMLSDEPGGDLRADVFRRVGWRVGWRVAVGLDDPLAARTEVRCADMAEVPVALFDRSVNPLLHADIVRSLRAGGIDQAPLSALASSGFELAAGGQVAFVHNSLTPAPADVVSIPIVDIADHAYGAVTLGARDETVEAFVSTAFSVAASL